jgi:ubiquitin C-terminal hydrolase
MAIKSISGEKFSDICKKMDEINKRKPSKEQVDELIDILNEIDESDDSNESNEQVAKNREENGIEQNWI